MKTLTELGFVSKNHYYTDQVEGLIMGIYPAIVYTRDDVKILFKIPSGGAVVDMLDSRHNEDYELIFDAVDRRSKEIKELYERIGGD